MGFPFYALVVCLLCALAWALLGGRTLRPKYKARPSYALPDPETTHLGRLFAEASAANGGLSGFLLLESGLDAFLARALLADAAERTLDVQYYILHDDTTGKLFMDHLLAAADRGVRVRLLLDDTATLGRDFAIATFDIHPRIEVRVFNPFVRRRSSRISRLLEFVTHPSRLNHRMHNKMFVADNAAAIVGGRNIGDEYFEAHAQVNFKDMDLLAVGPIARDVSACFDEFWNSEWAIPISAFRLVRPRARDLRRVRRLLLKHTLKTLESEYARRLRDADLLRKAESGSLQLVWAPAQTVYDRPRKISATVALDRSVHVGPQLLPLAEQAQEEIILVTPYFVPRDFGLALLTGLRGRGVRIRVLTNSLASTDVTIVHSGYARYRDALLRAGIELFEMKPTARTRWRRIRRKIAGSAGASLHAKILVADRKILYVGSFNLDPRSANLNTEMGLVVESPQLAREIVSLFDEAVQPANAYRLALEGRPNTKIKARASMRCGWGETQPSTKSFGWGGTRPSISSRLTWITEESGRTIRLHHEPMAGLWRRFLAGFISLFPIENQL
ncbi:MAG: phospholipase D family protein [Candidatus Sumerlaeia bacterium]|nr:phospholipase D family protein [Candidatus Sumerlaeia bacterium]